MRLMTRRGDLLIYAEEETGIGGFDLPHRGGISHYWDKSDVPGGGGGDDGPSDSVSQSSFDGRAEAVAM